jgi:hypothetical protein
MSLLLFYYFCLHMYHYLAHQLKLCHLCPRPLGLLTRSRRAVRNAEEEEVPVHDDVR